MVNGQPRNDALTKQRVDAGLRRADQKADRGAITRAVLLEPEPRRNHAARAQRQRNAERDRLRDAAEPAKLATREVARKQDVQQTGGRGSQEKPGRELKPYLPDRVEHAGDMGLGRGGAIPLERDVAQGVALIACGLHGRMRTRRWVGAVAVDVLAGV